MNFSSPEEARRYHLRTLADLLKRDNTEHTNESRFLKYVAGKLGFSDTDLDDILNDPELSPIIPEEEQERMTYFYHLLFMMKMDGSVKESEVLLVKELGFRLGFNPVMVDEMISVMRAHVGQPVPEEALLNIIRKYLN